MSQNESEKYPKKEEKLQYSKPEIEELELNEEVAPEMAFTSRAGMGNCKHTYI